MKPMRRTGKLRRGIRWLSICLPLALFSVVAVLENTHHHQYGHYFGYGPHVDVVSEDSYIGIPGQTKLYSARLTNYRVWPLKLTCCDFISDTLTPGTEYPYAVQRWDSKSESWLTIMEANEENFCHPYPLGQAETHSNSKLLWPGGSVAVMGYEATGARDPFRKGDLARFVVFRRIGEHPDWTTAMPSLPFVIEDDVPRDDAGSFRVQH